MTLLENGRYEVLFTDKTLGFSLKSITDANGSNLPVVDQLQRLFLEGKPCVGDTLETVNGQSTFLDNTVDRFAFAVGLVRAAPRPVILGFREANETNASKRLELVRVCPVCTFHNPA